MDSIIEKGLLFGSELDCLGYGYGTGPINGVLEKYRPHHLPDFINRDKCLFFYPTCLYRDFGNREIKIEVDKLDRKKMYVADLDAAQSIYNNLHEDSEEVDETFSKQYWNTLQPFDEYMSNPHKFKYAEVLYFGKIPFEKLEITTTLHPLAQILFKNMSAKYRVKRWGSVYGEIYITDKQRFTLDFNPFSSYVSLSSKSGSIHQEAVEHFENLFSFQNKRIVKDGKSMTIGYEQVKEKSN